MKYTNLREFASYLQQISITDLPKSVLLQAGDSFDLHEGYRLFKECAIRLLGETKVTFARAQEAGQIQALLAPSLFARSKTVVVIDDIERLKSREQELLKQYLAKPSSDAIVLLKTASSAASELAKLVATHGIILSLPEEKPWDKEAKVAHWIVAFCHSKGVAIAFDLASAVARECGQDRFFLQGELEKLLIFVGERKKIQPQDLEAILTIEPKSTLWQFSDAYVQKNSKEAIRILQQLEQQDVHYFVIVRHLRNVIHQALEMRALADDGISLADISARFPQLKGKMFEKAFQRAKGLTTSFLANTLVSIDKAESSLKNSPFDEQMILINLLVHT